MSSISYKCDLVNKNNQLRGCQIQVNGILKNDETKKKHKVIGYSSVNGYGYIF